jgi:hypothetical protein
MKALTRYLTRYLIRYLIRYLTRYLTRDLTITSTRVLPSSNAGQILVKYKRSHPSPERILQPPEDEHAPQQRPARGPRPATTSRVDLPPTPPHPPLTRPPSAFCSRRKMSTSHSSARPVPAAAAASAARRPAAKSRAVSQPLASTPCRTCAGSWGGGGELTGEVEEG